MSQDDEQEIFSQMVDENSDLVEDETITDVLNETMKEEKSSRNIREAFEEYIRLYGAPKGSFYDVSVLKEMAEEMNVAYSDEETLLEAVEEVRENAEGLISETIENNLKFFNELNEQ